MSGTRRWIFYFQFRSLFHCWDIVGRHWHLAGTVWYCSRRRHINTRIFGKSKPLWVHRNSNFLKSPAAKPFCCLSGSGFIQDHHVWIFPISMVQSFFFINSTALDDLWKEHDSLTILKLVGLRLWLLGVLFFILAQGGIWFWRLKNAKFQCHDFRLWGSSEHMFCEKH